MFDILFHEQDNKPLYQQLYELLREQIRTGWLKGGTRLPSVRALSVQLNSSKTPIETAYHMPIAEGYAVSVSRSGLYVAMSESLPSKPAADSRRNPPFNDASVPNFANTPSAPYASSPAIDFDPTALDSELFPVRTGQTMLKRSFDRRLGGMGSYGDPQRGVPLFGQADPFSAKPRCPRESRLYRNVLEGALAILADKLHGAAAGAD